MKETGQDAGRGRTVFASLRANATGPAVAGAVVGGMALYRAWGIEPAAWGAVCAADPAPWPCVPRSTLFWLQYEYGFGLAALVIGLAALALRSRRLGLAAVAAGGIALLDYNVTWGMVGVALGASVWIDGWPAWSRR